MLVHRRGGTCPGTVHDLHPGPRIAITAAGATIEDLGSKNGSFVNNARIDVPTALRHGNQLQFGRFTFVFRYDASPPSTEPDG